MRYEFGSAGADYFAKGVLKGGIEGGVSDWNRNLAFFTQAKDSKVLNLDFQFFCIDSLGILWKEFVIMFISRQDQNVSWLNSCIHYPKQDKHVISFYHIVVQ